MQTSTNLRVSARLSMPFELLDKWKPDPTEGILLREALFNPAWETSEAELVALFAKEMPDALERVRSMAAEYWAERDPPRVLRLPNGERRQTYLAPFYAPPEGDISVVGARQAEAIRDWFSRAAAEGRAWRNAEADADVGVKAFIPAHVSREAIMGGQGTGKTTSVLEQLAAQGAGLIWWLAVPTHRLASEALERYETIARPTSPRAMVVRGRGAESPTEKGATMCRRNDVVQKAIDEGVDVEKSICAVCPLRGACEYLSQMSQAKAAAADPHGVIYIVPHEYLYLNSSVPKPHALVIDEAISQPFTLSLLARKDISDVPASIRKGKKDLILGEAAGARLEMTLGAIHSVLGDGNLALRARMKREISLFAMQDALRTLGRLAEPPTVAPGEAADDEALKKALERGATGREWSKKVRPLVRAILTEWEIPGDRDTFRGLWIDRDDRVHICRLREAKLPEGRPLLWLDGTGVPEILQRVMPGLRCHVFAVDRKGTVVQTTGRTWSRTSLTARGLGDPKAKPLSAKAEADARRAREAIRAWIDDKPGTFVAASQLVLKMMRDEGLKSDGGHFGALRGLNAWEELERAVIVGYDQPPVDTIEDMARALSACDPAPFPTLGTESKDPHVAWVEGYRAGLYRQTRLRRMRDGTVRPVAVACHPDPLVDAVWCQKRDGEVMQAADRVRGAYKERALIFLSEVALPIAIDHEIDSRDLIALGLRAAGKTARMEGLSRLRDILPRHDAFPLVPEEMARLEPGIWASAWAAKAFLARLGGAEAAARSAAEKGDGPHIDLIYMSTVTFFRAAGARGRASVALVRVGADAKAALEAAMGRPVEILPPPAVAS